MVGERIMKAFNRLDWSVLGQTLAGAILLALLGAAPVIGGVIGFLAASLGLGALILTRAGTQQYPALAVAGPNVTPEPFVAPEPLVAPEPPSAPIPPPEPPASAQPPNVETPPSELDEPKQN
jgi:hypothetical protein